MELNKKALGLAMGTLWGASVLICTLLVVFRGGGDHLYLLEQFYIGYTVTVVGAFIGLLYGFVDGFIAGWIFAWVYNFFAKEKS